MRRVFASVANRLRLWNTPHTATRSSLERAFDARLAAIELTIHSPNREVDPHALMELNLMAKAAVNQRKLAPVSTGFRTFRRCVLWAAPILLIAAAVYHLPSSEAWLEVETSHVSIEISRSATERPMFADSIIASRISFASVQSLKGLAKTTIDPPVSLAIEGCSGQSLLIQNPIVGPLDVVSVSLDSPSSLTSSAMSFARTESAVVRPAASLSVRLQVRHRGKHQGWPTLTVTVPACHSVQGLPTGLRSARGGEPFSYEVQVAGTTLDLRVSIDQAGIKAFASSLQIQSLDFQDQLNIPSTPYTETASIHSGILEFESVRDLKRVFREGERLTLDIQGLISTIHPSEKGLIVRAQGRLSNLRIGFQRMSNRMPTALDWIRSLLREGSIGLVILYALIAVLSGKDFFRDTAREQLSS